MPGQVQMGVQVCIDRGTIVAATENGSSGAYVFTGSGATWTQQAKLVSPTGGSWMSVALQGDTIAQSDPASNVIYLYDRTGTTWNRTATIAIPATGNDAFGDQLALSGTLLSATADGPFYVFSHTAAGWVLAQSFSGGGIAGTLALVNQGKTFALANPFASAQGYSNPGIVQAFYTPPPPPPRSGWPHHEVRPVRARAIPAP